MGINVRAAALRGHSDSTPPLARTKGDLARTLFVLLVIMVLITASFWILRPFLLPLLWAAMIVVATWPLMQAAERRLHRRGLAVALMCITMLMVFVLPVVLAIAGLAGNADAIQHALQSLATVTIPPPPQWVAGIPLVGDDIAARWVAVAGASKEELAAQVAPYAARAAQWVASGLGSIGALTVQVLLMVILAAILYANGETARAGLIRFGRRLAGVRGEGAVVLAGQAIRAVALGVVVTALVQTVLAGVGLAVAGVPFAGLLTGVVLLLCIAQLGPVLVLVPAIIWLFWTGQTGWGVALLVWAIPVGVLDNVLRPMLIKRGADLPMLLIFAGVIGGLVAFGIIGLFLGPVVLAIGYTLLTQWVNEPEVSADVA
jgi:predicted PurR-regulated permease PerM